ncbi:MAG: radical SAM protein, partial [Desulfobulbaceae bacterium]|nr:radical SAM protein [Desulfobulbaceae bacterium]
VGSYCLMKYLFGPVNSRRLGLSQGIDLIPSKVCNFNCIYCEVGPTVRLTCQRQEYFPTDEILAEIDTLLADPDAATLDIFTVTASGEPTLHSGLGKVIRHIKHKTAKPVAVLTNGSTFHLAEVRQELLAADLVIPSLDSARPESYRRINRPATCAVLEDIIDGLIKFVDEFPGEVWLEILLAKGINDSEEDIEALVKAVAKINPARVQLNTVVRPPLETFAHPLSQAELKAIANRFQGRVEIIANFSSREQHDFRPLNETEILEMLKRRPCTATDVGEALNFDPAETTETLAQMVTKGSVRHSGHAGKTYYHAN